MTDTEKLKGQSKGFYLMAGDGTVMCDDGRFAQAGKFKRYQNLGPAIRRAAELQRQSWMPNKPFTVCDTQGNEYFRSDLK